MELLKLCGPYAPQVKSALTPAQKGIAQAKDVYHKKKNVKFTEVPVEVKRNQRLQEMDARQKVSRQDTHMAKREQFMARHVATPKKVQDKTGSTSESSGVGGSSATMFSNTDMSLFSEASSSCTLTSTTRKDQLQRWKMEKNLLNNPNAGKPVFKPAGNIKPPPVVPKPLPPVVPVPGGATITWAPKRGKEATTQGKNVLGSATNLQALPGPPTAASKGPGLEERRVTRSMAKKVEPGPGGGVHAKNMTQRLQNLAISANKKDEKKATARTPPAVKGLKNQQAAPSSPLRLPKLQPSKENKQKIPTSKPAAAKPTSPTEIAMDMAPPPPAVQPLAPPPATQPPQPTAALPGAIINSQVQVVKSLKPKAIDDVYTEYNGLFAEACNRLTKYRSTWKALLETNSNDIPENVKDDIISTLGAAKLLLDSKLPQFGQLLFSYLCKSDVLSTRPILQCDLQGWWDVASIQVEKVCGQFDGLKRLEQQKWIELKQDFMTSTSATCSDGSGEAKKKVHSRPNLPRPPLNPLRVAPSKGMREFLAMKRNKANAEKVSDSADGSSEDSVQECKAFEGGFFAIRSPSRTNTPSKGHSTDLNSSSSRDTSMSGSSRRTPRQVSTRLSLRMLSMRQSMGAIYAAGAREDSPIVQCDPSPTN